MTKFVLNVRHRPTMTETIEQRFLHFVAVLSNLPSPWGLEEGRGLKLPPVGTALSTHAKLRGKLGAGLSGDLKLQYRSRTNLNDRAADDDAAVVEFDSSKVGWRQLIEDGFPGYVRAIGAYIGHLYRWDEAPNEWLLLKEAARKADRNLDGRDGFFRFGPVSFMDRELCRRGCNGMTPEQVAERLAGIVPDVRLFDDGVLIVAASHFPEQAEIVATDRKIRERLDLTVWG